MRKPGTGLGGVMQGDSWVSELPVSDEAILTLRRRLAGELDEFVVARGGPKASRQRLPGLLDDILLRDLKDLITACPVVAAGAPEFAVRLSFCPLGYRRSAEAAQDAELAG